MEQIHILMLRTHASSTVQVPQTDRLPSICLKERHPVALRWMHWLNFPLLFIMVWSGFLIYWADSASGYTYEHQVYRIGLGPFTLFRLFPDWFYRLFHFDGHLTRGLAFHAFFMWLFAANGVLYAFFLVFSGQWRAIVPDRNALTEFFSAVRAEITGKHALHPGRKYSAAQRVAYTLVILMGSGAVLTGIAIWKPTSLHLITTLCGGYQTARWLHFWLTIGFCFFFFVHVVQVLRAGWNILRSMITGAEIVSVSEPDKAHRSFEGYVHER